MIPEEQRPIANSLMDCITSKWTHEKVTDEDIETIVLRWQQMKQLRELYLDANISGEFNRLRTELIPVSAIHNTVRRARLAKPGLATPGITTISVLPSRVRESRKYTSDFKTRFYKALVLHSMAVAASRLGRAASSPDSFIWRCHPFIKVAIDLWNKRSLFIGGRTIDLNLTDRLDGLEIYDFLYSFLLSKLMPGHQLDAWMKLDLSTPPQTRGDKTHNQHCIHKWHELLFNSQRVLLPLDLVDLIRKRAWSSEAMFPPQDRSTYMLVRGMFDDHFESDIGWYKYHQRCAMLRVLRPEWRSEDSELDEPCWWDLVRMRSGSPFLPEAIARFPAELLRVEADELAERNLVSRELETVWMYSANLARDPLFETLKGEVTRLERLVKRELLTVPCGDTSTLPLP